MDIEGLMQKSFYKLGQLTCLSILLQSRGPECLHPAVVRALFCTEQPLEFEQIGDGKNNHDLDSITNENFNCLYEMNINPLGKEKEDLKRFYLLAALVHSNFSAIQQYSNGVVPVSKSILHPSKYNKLRHMFKRGLDYNYDFNQVFTLFRYSQTDFETGLNEELNLRDWIIEFELFLMNIGNNEVFTNEGVQITYKDILQFLTGFDRIPTYGFEKTDRCRICEVFVSTCFELRP